MIALATAREESMERLTLCAVLAVGICLSASAGLIARGETPAKSGSPHGQRDWPAYGGGAENTHYSSLAQINRKNVKRLRVAWTFDTEESGGLQTSPIIVANVLYGLTPTQKVFALDAASGKLLWKFDSGIRGTQPNRGLTYWAEGQERRILVGVMNFVYALDAGSGKPIASFGKGGRIDLREDLGRDPRSQAVYLTSPGAIYKDLLIVGGRNPETLPAPPGNIRAYDVRTGNLRWSFHTIPQPGKFGYETWPKDAWKTSGAANNWAGMVVDARRGVVYVPTGSAAFDFYGADRVGDDLFANCLLALNAETGERLWHFQGVRHDLWDRDFPAPPTLLTVKREGKKVDAVVQTTKQGFVFLFDRSNGRSLFPLEFQNYPASTVQGEVAAQQQVLPTKPAPYARQILTTDVLTNRTPEINQWALDQFQKFRSEGQFVPFGLGIDTVVFPGFDGGAEWGGSDDQLFALVSYLTGGESKELVSSESLQPSKYRFTGYRKFLDPEGYPAVAPPWGTLNAINLNTGEYLWRIPLGEYPELAAQGLKHTGTENYGGPIVTAGGLVFIGATNFDKKFRAFDKSTGQLLWEATLPFAGNATPATYAVDGHQFVVIAAGGGKDAKSPSGGVYVAFALPR